MSDTTVDFSFKSISLTFSFVVSKLVKLTSKSISYFLITSEIRVSESNSNNLFVLYWSTTKAKDSVWSIKSRELISVNKLPEITQKEEENIEIKLEKKNKKEKNYNEEEPMVKSKIFNNPITLN